MPYQKRMARTAREVAALSIDLVSLFFTVCLKNLGKFIYYDLKSFFEERVNVHASSYKHIYIL